MDNGLKRKIEMVETGVAYLDAGVKMKLHEQKMKPVKVEHSDVEVKIKPTEVADLNVFVKMKDTEQEMKPIRVGNPNVGVEMKPIGVAYLNIFVKMKDAKQILPESFHFFVEFAAKQYYICLW